MGGEKVARSELSRVFLPRRWFADHLGGRPSVKRILSITAIGGCFLYFLLKTSYFALSISPHVPPDEQTHVERTLVFAKVLGIPRDTIGTYHLGPIARYPNLYHFVMAKLVQLNWPGWNNLLLLRLANVLLGCIALGATLGIARTLTRSVSVQVLTVAMMSNTLMLTFLVSAVSYDNFVNCLCALSYWFFFRYTRRRDTWFLALAGVSVLLACLAKVTAVPVALLLTVCLLLHDWRTITNPRRLLSIIPTRDFRMILACGLVLVAVVLNVELYGVNLVKYGKMIPDTDQILSMEHAMENRIFARVRIIKMYKEGSISLEQAVAMAQRIDLPGDRECTMSLLQIQQRIKTGELPLLDRTAYSFEWIQRMLSSTYGILAHLSMFREGKDLSGYILLLVIWIVLLARRFRMSDLDGRAKYLFLIAVPYIVYFMQGLGYPSHRLFGAVNAEVQGRYLFPILPLIYFSVSYYLLSGWPKYVRYSIVAAVSIFFVAGEMPFFLSHASKAWFLP